MRKKIEIYDTTLRDGNQALNVSFSLEDKLLVAEKLYNLGVHYIEGGWPNSTNKTDIEFFKQVRKSGLRSKITAFGSTRRPNISPAKDNFLKTLLKADVPVITIFGKCWDLHVKDVIRTSLDENLRMIESSCSYLKKRCESVFFDAEHFFNGYQENPQYALKVLNAAINGGADRLILCDTNGGMLPMEIQEVFRKVRRTIPDVILGIHAHNDSGNATANSLIAVQEGAVQIHGTINGLGERCGNADLCSLIPNLSLKMGRTTIPARKLPKLRSVSLFVSEIANLVPNIRQPYVGESAFTHKAGPHIDGVLKNSRSFEHVSPQEVGNDRKYILSNQAGGSAVVEKLKKVKPDINKKDKLVKKLLKEIKSLEDGGYQFEAADGSFQLLAKRKLGLFKELFKFKGFRVIIEKRENGENFAEATIKVKKGREIVHTAAEGDGPVNALDNAVRKALVQFYPQLKNVSLEDFKVRVLDGRDGTSAKVRVLIESHDGKEHWGTIGVSPNIIEASWIALLDSLNYKIMKS